MQLLDWHIGRHVLIAILVVLLIVVGLDFTIGLAAEISHLTPTYHFGWALQYIFLLIPSRVSEFAPLAVLVGCLTGLGTLASQNELIVMRAAGVSMLRIIRAVLQPVLFVIVLAMLAGEYVTPWMEQLAQSERSRHVGIASHNGLWYRNGDRYILLHSIKPNGALQGVSQFSFINQELAQRQYSSTGQFDDDSWVLHDSTVTHFTSNGLVSEQIEAQPWNIMIDPELLVVLNLDPESIALHHLSNYSDYLERHQLDARPYQLAYWRKLLQPLASLSLVLIGIAFIFGPLRSVSLGQRVVVGVVCGLIFHYIQDILGPASTLLGLHPLMAALLPVLSSTLLGLLLLRRAW